MSPTQGQAVIIGVTFAPAISKNLKAFLYGWLPLSDAAGILFANGLTVFFLCYPLPVWAQPVLFPVPPRCCPGLVVHCPFQGRIRQNNYCRWALLMCEFAIPGFQIRVNGILSNNIRILTPKNRGYWSRKGHSVEKTPFFEVFRKVLADRWLRGYLFVIVWFTKHRIAKGKVSLRERPCFTA